MRLIGRQQAWRFGVRQQGADDAQAGFAGQRVRTK